MTSYDPRGPMIARVSPSMVFSTTTGRDVNKLFTFIGNCLAQAGWQRAGNTFVGGIIETWDSVPGEPYKQRICIDLEKIVAPPGNTSYIKFKVYDDRYFRDETGVILACSSDEYRIFVCPFQIIIRPKSVQLGGRNNLLISCLRIPIFVRETTYINAVLAIEGDQFFSNFYGTGFTDSCYTAIVSRSGGFFEWRGSGSNQGMPQFIALGNDNIFFLRGDFDLFAPAWLCWGLSNANTPTTMQGFLWNCVNWYSNRLQEYKTVVLNDVTYYAMIPEHFNNTLLYRIDG